MTRRCALQALVVMLLAVAGHALESSDSVSQLALREEKPACDLCEGFVTSVAAYLSDPKTQEDVKHILEKNVCESLPDEFYDTCAEEVGVVYAQAVAMIISALDPADVCGVFGLCPSANSIQGPFDCGMCRVVALTLLQRLKDPKVREDMHKAFLEACDELELVKRPKCIVDVNALFLSLESIMDDIDPDLACELTQFCPKPGFTLARPGALDAFHVLWKELAAVKPEGQNKLGDEASCQDCKTIVLQAVAILQNPKTQMEMIEYAKQSCSILGDWKDECEQYVTLYGPLVINMVITYLQPEAVCEQLGYCPPARLV